MHRFWVLTRHSSPRTIGSLHLVHGEHWELMCWKGPQKPQISIEHSVSFRWNNSANVVVAVHQPFQQQCFRFESLSQFIVFYVEQQGGDVICVKFASSWLLPLQWHSLEGNKEFNVVTNILPQCQYHQPYCKNARSSLRGAPGFT